MVYTGTRVSIYMCALIRVAYAQCHVGKCWEAGKFFIIISRIRRIKTHNDDYHAARG